MKKTKKIISFILAVVMILSVVPMQSLALFENISNPRIADVELSDNRAVSCQDAYNAANGDNPKGFQYIGYGWGYEYTVYLTDGTVIEVIDNYGIGGSVDEFRVIEGDAKNIEYCYVDATVVPEKCSKALKAGKDKVVVGYQVDIGFANGGTRYNIIRKETKLIEKYVTDIKFLGTLEGEYSSLNDEGNEFEITYYDGRKEVYAVEILEYEAEFADGIHTVEEHSLNGYPMSVYFPENNFYINDNGEKIFFEGYEVEYLDGRILYIKEELECPYTSVEITDYTIDVTGALQKLSYKVVYADGSIVEDTYIPEDEKINIYDKVYQKFNEGVYIEYFVDDEEDFQLSVSVGEEFWEMYDVITGHASENCDCICHKDGFNRIIYIFKCIFWILTFSNGECQCGARHW